MDGRGAGGLTSITIKLRISTHPILTLVAGTGLEPVTSRL